MMDEERLKYCLSKWPDTREDKITREEAAKIAEQLNLPTELPAVMSQDFTEGWEAACDTIAIFFAFP